MAKVSIIMPSYNVKSYIRECMDSVVGQSFEDLEILCIDAGSTDGTKEILEEYAQKDPRVRLIASPEKSYGFQVNLGMDLATGEYIGFVETDDYIEEDMVSYLYGLLRDTDLDFAKGATLYCYSIAPDLSLSQLRKEFPAERFSERGGSFILDANREPDVLWHDFHLWNGLYRREILKEIRLSETKGAAYQDTGFMIALYTQGCRGIFSDHPVYHYRKTNYGASAYDPRSISYLVYEFDRAKERFPQWEDKWKKAVLVKLYYHLSTKLYMMALEGRYWEQAQDEMLHLQGMIRDEIAAGTMSLQDFPQDKKANAECFLQDPKKLYEKFCAGWEEPKKKREKLLSFASHRPLIVFGAGAVGKYVLSMLLARGMQIDAICDNAEDMQGSTVQGIPVLSAQNACSRFPDARFIVSTGKKNREVIREQLLHAGVGEDAVYVFEYVNPTVGTTDYYLLLDTK